MSVKGMEMPAYDPRGMKAQGLAYATSNRGGCHLRANMLGPEILGVPKMVDRFATLGKAGLLINLQNLNAVLDSLSVCKFTAFAMKEDYYARQLSAVWGETVEPQELLLLGERIWNAERLFNLAAGFTRADDTLPPRLLHEPVPAGPSAGPGRRLAADARRVLHLARLGRGRRALGGQARAARPDETAAAVSGTPRRRGTPEARPS